MRIVIAGGGTGGHTSPAVAIIEALRARDPMAQFIWVGKRGSIEERVSAHAGVPFQAVRSAGWPRGWTWRRITAAFAMLLGIVQSLGILRRFHADAVIGVGGYVSLGPLLAARLLRLPHFAHEQNKRLGMANRLVARSASCLFLSFENTIGVPGGARTQITGNPVRAGFLSAPDTYAAKRALGFDEGTPLVLIVGGSQGARSINTAMREAVHLFEPGTCQFYWMTGKSDIAMAEAAAKTARATTRASAFIDDMVTACAAADLIVCRAGASTTAELAAIGRPSILIPYPHATDNHQEHNARALEAAGAAAMMLDRDCNGVALADAIRALLQTPERLEDMARAAATLGRPHAAAMIAEKLCSVVAPQ